MSMMAFKNLLDPRVLTASYAQRDGARRYFLTEAYFQNPRPIEGQDYSLIFYPAMMDPAPGNQPGAEAHVLTPGPANARNASLFCAFNKVPLPGEALNALREPDSLAIQDMGRTTVSRVFDEFAERHKIFKEVVLAKTLVEGVVYLNAQGQVLENSTNAVISASFGVPAANQGNLGGIISTLWDNSAALIGDQIDLIRNQAQLLNAAPPTDIWLHPNHKSSLRNNTQFNDWAKRNQAMITTVLQGDVIENLWGLNWHFYGGKYRGADGNMHDFIPTTQGFLTADPRDPWVRATQGSTLVPKDLSLVNDWQAALGNMEKFYGPFSYARLIDDPVTLYLYLGDKFGLHFADPNAIWQPTLFSA